MQINPRSILIFALVCIGALSAEVTTAQSRPLTFSDAQSVGVVAIGPVLPQDVSAGAPEPKRLPARGEISIDATKQVTLTVSRDVDLSFLDDLPADGIQGIVLSDRQLDVEQFDSLARFVDLQVLELSRCHIANDLWAQIEPLAALRKLSIRSSDDSIVGNPAFAKWVASCAQLQTAYCTPSLKAPAVKILSGHPTLTSVQISVEKDREAIVFQLLQQLPKLDRLIAIVDKEVSPRALDRISALEGLSSITISHATVDGDLLRRMGQIESLMELRLIAATVGDGFLEGLVENRNLESVLVHTMPMDNESAFRRKLGDTLLQMPKLRKLPKISDVDDATLQKLFARDDIEELYIDGLARGTDPQMFLDGLGKLTKLRSLSIAGVAITDDQLKSLRTLTELRSLSLVHTSVRGPGWRHLSELPFLRDVQIMMEARRREPELSSLGELPHLSRLQILGLGFEPKHFFPIAQCKQLQNLALSEGIIDDTVATKIATLPNLRHINAWDAKLTAAGAEAFLATKTLSSINLAGDIPVKSIRRLAELPNLVSLSVSSTAVDEQAAKTLNEGLSRVANVKVRPK